MPTDDSKRAVLLNSGGIDSLASAKYLREQGFYTHSLFIMLGQPQQEMTMPAAAKIAEQYCDEHSIMEIFEDDSYVAEAAVGHGKNVPWLNHVVFMLGAVFAECNGYRFLASGTTGNVVDPDTFEGAFMAFLRTATRRDPIIPILPLNGWRKQQIIDYVGPDELLPKTYSCNHVPPCGKCPRCKQRNELGIDSD